MLFNYMKFYRLHKNVSHFYLELLFVTLFTLSNLEQSALKV